MTVLDSAEASTSAPSIKLRNVGDNIGVAIFDLAKDQDVDMEGNPKFFKNGNPAERIIISGVVIGGTGVIKDDTGADVPVSEGDEVSIWLTGAKWYNYIQAKKENPAIKTGTVFTATFANEEAPSNPAHSPKHVWSFSWRDGDNAELTAKCDALFSAKTAVVLDEADEPMAPAPVEPKF